MNKILKPAFLLIVAASSGCNFSPKDKKAEVAEKQEQVKKKKTEISKLNLEIKTLEDEIVKLDPSKAKAEQPKLVALTPIGSEKFTHYIDLQGRVEAENTYNVMPRGAPGQV